VNIYEEDGGKASDTPVAVIHCRNGLHIEHVSSGVSRDKKALLREVVSATRCNTTTHGRQQEGAFCELVCEVQCSALHTAAAVRRCFTGSGVREDRE
jgi:hypothetical protein